MRASVHTQHMPHIMIVNRLKANKQRFRPVRSNSNNQRASIKFDRIPFDQKVRPLSFRPENFDLFTATLTYRVLQTRSYIYLGSITSRVLQAENQPVKVSAKHGGDQLPH